MSLTLESVAQQITDEMKLPGQEVVWLLVTDMEGIRHAATKAYPTLVLTNTAKVKTCPHELAPFTRQTHSMLMLNVHWCSQGLARHTTRHLGGGGVHALRAAVGEKYLISLADYFIVLAHSGFGRQPAVQSRRWNAIYMLLPHVKHRDCSRGSANSLADIVSGMPGM